MRRFLLRWQRYIGAAAMGAALGATGVNALEDWRFWPLFLTAMAWSAVAAHSGEPGEGDRG